jgi:hypothetical protein
LNTPGSLISGAFRGGSSGLSGAGKNGNVLAGLGKAYQTQSTRNAMSIANAAAGANFFRRMGARASNFALGTTPADWDQTKLDQYKSIDSAVKAYDEQLTSSALKYSGSYSFGTGTGSKLAGKTINLGTHKRYIDLAKQGDAASMAYLSGLGYTDVQDAEKDYNINVEKEFKRMYYDDVNSGTITDNNSALVLSAREEANATLKGVTLYDRSGAELNGLSVNGDNSGDIRKYTTFSTHRVKNSSSYKANAQAAKNVAGKKK